MAEWDLWGAFQRGPGAEAILSNALPSQNRDIYKMEQTIEPPPPPPTRGGVGVSSDLVRRLFIGFHPVQKG